MHLNYLDCPKFVLNMAKKILIFKKERIIKLYRFNEQTNISS